MGSEFTVKQKVGFYSFKKPEKRDWAGFEPVTETRFTSKTIIFC
jgi:hypothetical protein